MMNLLDEGVRHFGRIFLNQSEISTKFWKGNGSNTSNAYEGQGGFTSIQIGPR